MKWEVRELEIVSLESPASSLGETEKNLLLAVKMMEMLT